MVTQALSLTKNKQNQARIPRFFNCVLNLERKLAAAIWRRNLNVWNMFSGDERDRTANLLVANREVEANRNRLASKGLDAVGRLRPFSRYCQAISQELARFITVSLPWQSFMRRCDHIESVSHHFGHVRALPIRGEPLSRPRARQTGRARLQLSCRGGPAYNQRIVAKSSERSQTMGMLDKEPDVNTDQEPGVQDPPTRPPRVLSLATTPEAESSPSRRRNRPRMPEQSLRSSN